jgi:hypothetical protein
MIDIHNALGTTWSHCKYQQRGNDYSGLEWYDKEVPKPTQSEIEQEIIRLTQIQENTEYQRLRAKEYPSIQRQMDMQYWDSVNNTTTWQDAIEAVKAKYPKPEGV